MHKYYKTKKEVSLDEFARRDKCRKQLHKLFLGYMQHRQAIYEQISILYKECRPRGLNIINTDTQKLFDKYSPAQKLFEYYYNLLESKRGD